MRFLTSILIVLCCLSFGQAQDVHFSQFYNAPQMLNPALTGKINGKFRAGINYRNQWFGQVNGRTTYSTPALSYDMPIHLSYGDVVGAGAYLVNDRSSGGLLTRLQVVLGGAYHKSFGEDGKHSASLGIQFAYIQRRLDINNIRFASQQGDGIFFDPGISSGENIDGTTNNVDLNAGFMWSSKLSKNAFIYAGIALYNMVQPFNTFTDDTDDLMRRLSISGGADVRLSPKFSLLPSFIYMNQAKAYEANLGVSGAIDINKDFVLYTGMYYRVKDAVIPYVGADYKGFRLGLSYDFNASSLDAVDGGHNGAIELSLMYIGKFVSMPDVKPSMYCPRF